jgi:hypothetical protein
VRSLWRSGSASTASSPVSAFSATPPRVFGSRRNTATTWASTSTHLHVTCSPQRKSFRSSPNKLDTYCNVQQETSDGYLSRNSCHSLVRHGTFFLLFRRQDSSYANFTPYLATRGEAASATPRSSVAIYSGGHRYPTTPTARTYTARSSQRTYTATVRDMVGDNTKRQTRSARLLRNRGRKTAHYMEGTQGRPYGRPQLLATPR